MCRVYIVALHFTCLPVFFFCSNFHFVRSRSKTKPTNFPFQHLVEFKLYTDMGYRATSSELDFFQKPIGSHILSTLLSFRISFVVVGVASTRTVHTHTHTHTHTETATPSHK